MQRRLAGDGITLIGQLAARYDRVGTQLGRLARGEDASRRRCPRPGPFDLRGNHPGAGRSRCEGAGARARAVVRAAVGPPEASLARHGDDHLKAQDRRFSVAHALPPPRRSDLAGRDLVSHRFYLTRQRSRRRQNRFQLIGVRAGKLTDRREADPPTLFDRDSTGPGGSSARWIRFAAGSARARYNWAAACLPPTMRRTL